VSRPSPPGDGEPGRDLLAHARDLLPPEVDVVEFAGPAASEGDAMTPLAKAVAPLLAGAVARSACSPSHDEIRASAARSKAHVTDVSNEVLDQMTALGRLYDNAEGEWRQCRDDKLGWLSYFITGSLDPDPDSPATEALVDQIIAALEPTGYRFVRMDDGDDVLTWESIKGEVNVQLTGYGDDPYVLFDISGGCVEVADLDGEYRYELPETVR
jgi:hypothetical protein